MPVKNILIVTCKEHWEQCSFLLQSIDYYLTGYQITLVDNTPVPVGLEYELTNNHLKIIDWYKVIPRRIVIDNNSNTFDLGWISQQLIKLSAHTLFKEQYVCLDSSSVILKSFEKTNWPRDLWLLTPTPNQPFFKFYQAVKEKFNLCDAKVTPAQVPFILDSKYVSTMLAQWEDWNSFEQWFTSFKHPSEFWLYSLWLQKNGIKDYTNSPHYTQEPLLLLHNRSSWEYVNKHYENFDYFTVGCIKRPLWEDPDFYQLIKDKGLNFLKP